MQWVVLGLILIGWVVMKIFEGISDTVSHTQRSNEQKKKFDEERNQKYLGRDIDLSRDLYERNLDIIKKFEKKISSHSSRYYYIDNETRDCINEICLAENKSNIKPGYTYLSTWRGSAPQEYQDLANKIHNLFSERQKKLQENEEIEAENDKKQKYQMILTKYSDLIEQFKDVAYRKVTVIDDYGEESWDVLDKEIDLVVSKIAKKEGYGEDDFKKWKKYSFYIPDEITKLREYLKNTFKTYYSHKKKQPINDVDVENMTGIEFETYLANLLKSKGFDNVTGTATTGDQGADLIAKKDGKTIIIQAKRYGGSVGNKAVQEVISALSFYGGDEGWVMTNSTFTKSAKELARKSGVRLFDLHDLKHFKAEHVSV